MALVVTMLLYDGLGQQPVALTNSVLRPDLFRITLETPQAGLDGERLQAALALAGTDIAAAGLALADWRRPCLAPRRSAPTRPAARFYPDSRPIMFRA